MWPVTAKLHGMKSVVGQLAGPFGSKPDTKAAPSKSPPPQVPGPSGRLEIRNTTSSALEIMVEMYPDRYLLQPGEEMVIEANLKGAPFSINPYDGGLQIYPGNDVGPPVTINGVRAEPDWETKI